jgi:hypothetical protein
VIIVANHGCRIDIPSGAVLEDKVVSGNLRYYCFYMYMYSFICSLILRNRILDH